MYFSKRLLTNLGPGHNTSVAIGDVRPERLDGERFRNGIIYDLRFKVKSGLPLITYSVKKYNTQKINELIE